MANIAPSKVLVNPLLNNNPLNLANASVHKGKPLKNKTRQKEKTPSLNGFLEKKKYARFSRRN